MSMVHSTMPLTGTATCGAFTFWTVADGAGALQSGVHLIRDVFVAGLGSNVTLERRKQCGFHPACFGGSNSPAQQSGLASQASAQACAEPRLFSATTDLVMIAVAGCTVQFRAVTVVTATERTNTPSILAMATVTPVCVR